MADLTHSTTARGRRVVPNFRKPPTRPAAAGRAASGADLALHRLAQQADIVERDGRLILVAFVDSETVDALCAAAGAVEDCEDGDEDSCDAEDASAQGWGPGESDDAEDNGDMEPSLGWYSGAATASTYCPDDREDEHDGREPERFVGGEEDRRIIYGEGRAALLAPKRNSGSKPYAQVVVDLNAWRAGRT